MSARSRSPRASSLQRNQSRSRSPLRDRRSHSYSRSYSRSRSRSRSRSYTRSRSRSPTPLSTTKIVIERLTKNVRKAHIEEIFSVYGTIASLDMPMNRRFDVNRGLCYIIYEDAKSADLAISCMHEGQLDGSVLSVAPVLPRRRSYSRSYSRSPDPRRSSAKYGNGRTERRGRSYTPDSPRRRSRRDSRSRSLSQSRSRSRSRSYSRSPSRSRGRAVRRRRRSRSSSYSRSRSSVSHRRSRSPQERRSSRAGSISPVMRR